MTATLATVTVETPDSAVPLPRENLIRALSNAPLLVRSENEGSMPTLTGHFARFNEWTEIRSAWEGNFMERFAPTSLDKTLREGRDRMRVLFQHGQDPQIGDKPLGPIERLEPDGEGAYYEVPLLDTSYNRELIPGLEAGLYGASFRFEVLREDVKKKPGISAGNPKGLPERTVTEARVREFGPVTFPAYAGATAGLRSMTDEYMISRFSGSPDRLAQLLARATGTRFDNEDVSCLAQMIALAAQFIDDQDEADDQSALTEMQQVVQTLTGLLQGETVEPEPTEAEDDRNAPSADAARKGTSPRSAARPVRKPLRGAKTKEDTPSWRLSRT